MAHSAEQPHEWPLPVSHEPAQPGVAISTHPSARTTNFSRPTAPPPSSSHGGEGNVAIPPPAHTTPAPPHEAGAEPIPLQNLGQGAGAAQPEEDPTERRHAQTLATSQAQLATSQAQLAETKRNNSRTRKVAYAGAGLAAIGTAGTLGFNAANAHKSSSSSAAPSTVTLTGGPALQSTPAPSFPAPNTVPRTNGMVPNAQATGTTGAAQPTGRVQVPSHDGESSWQPYPTQTLSDEEIASLGQPKQTGIPITFSG